MRSHVFVMLDYIDFTNPMSLKYSSFSLANKNCRSFSSTNFCLIDIFKQATHSRTDDFDLCMYWTNAFFVGCPEPSAILRTIEVDARFSWSVRENISSLGNFFVTAYTLSTISMHIFHTSRSSNR